MPRMNDEFWELAERLVPDHDVAPTVQGELVRAVLRLTAECSRNGCGNWDGYFEALAQFALDRFSDGTVESDLAGRARSMLEQVRDYGRSVGDPECGPMNRPDLPPIPLAEQERVYRILCDGMDEPLEEAAVQWCLRHPALIPFEPGPDHGALD
ncbi:MAG: hypothetical protein U0840_27595 [Gemmataceae bacterium]